MPATTIDQLCDDCVSEFKLPKSWRKESPKAYRIIKRHDGPPCGGCIHVAYCLRALELVKRSFCEFHDSINAFAIDDDFAREAIWPLTKIGVETETIDSILYKGKRLGDLVWPMRILVAAGAFQFVNDHYAGDVVDVDEITAVYINGLNALETKYDESCG
jgi:hypothetical protein